MMERDNATSQDTIEGCSAFVQEVSYDFIYPRLNRGSTTALDFTFQQKGKEF